MDRRAHGGVPIHAQVAGSFGMAGGGAGPASAYGARPPGTPLCRDARAQMAPKKQFRAELFFYITMYTARFHYVTPMFYVPCPYLPIMRSSKQLGEVSTLDPAPYAPTTCLLPAPGGQWHHGFHMFLGMPCQHRKPTCD